MKKLDYNIHNCSSFTSVYVPENIKQQTSNDLSSRWSSDSNVPPQYITLKLIRPAIVKSVTFGKYEQTHACNVRRFKILGGLEENNMLDLLVGNLKNDNVKETFALRHTLGNGYLPVRYIQIVPILSWSPSFNFTIWYVELTGDDDQLIVEDSIKHYNLYREKEIVRLCMKHFRQHNYMEALRGLENETKISLEDPLLTEFHSILVTNADYDGAEKFLENSLRNGIFMDYISNKEYSTIWEQIDTSENNQIRPGMRGGHQMCIDTLTSTIYLFGGWDGNKDLNDLWSYDITSKTWTLLCADAYSENGPSPRSCHKMCLDTKQKQIFMLGRYLDVQYRSMDTLQSDFYMYDITSNKWLLIAEDTSALGGPYLIFDHQMCMDVEERTLYVFGGRVLSQPLQTDEVQNQLDTVFSGLFSYHVATNTWKELLPDCASTGLSVTNTVISRVGHSMLFHPVHRKLYIFAGQRNKEYINDFFTFDVDSKTIEHIYKIAENELGICPAPGFTQRATIDPETDEIFVLSGLSKEKEKRDDNVQNSVWVYKIRDNKWLCIYQNDNTSDSYWKKNSHLEPCPRFAHQLVYDDKNKVHYLFGGNPGRTVDPKLRLDDFWKLKLCKPSQNELLHRCKLLIRKYHFRELAKTDSVAALYYLRTKLAELIDHKDSKQTEEFHQLASVLFQENDEFFFSLSQTKSEIELDNVKSLPETSSYYLRSKLYEYLIMYFPEDMVQPKGNLSDLLKL